MHCQLTRVRQDVADPTTNLIYNEYNFDILSFCTRALNYTCMNARIRQPAGTVVFALVARGAPLFSLDMLSPSRPRGAHSTTSQCFQRRRVPLQAARSASAARAPPSLAPETTPARPAVRGRQLARGS